MGGGSVWGWAVPLLLNHMVLELWHCYIHTAKLVRVRKQKWSTLEALFGQNKSSRLDHFPTGTLGRPNSHSTRLYSATVFLFAALVDTPVQYGSANFLDNFS